MKKTNTPELGRRNINRNKIFHQIKVIELIEAWTAGMIKTRVIVEKTDFPKLPKASCDPLPCRSTFDRNFSICFRQLI